MKSVEERLAALERGVRVWRVAACCLAAMLALVVGLAAAPQGVPDVVRAKRFEVMDGDRVAASIETASGLTKMTIFDTEGNSQVLISADKNDSFLVIGGEVASPNAGVTLSATRYRGTSEASAAVCGANKTGLATLHVDEKGKARMSIDAPFGTIWSAPRSP
jgi:hypothetical protein